MFFSRVYEGENNSLNFYLDNFALRAIGLNLQ